PALSVRHRPSGTVRPALSVHTIVRRNSLWRRRIPFVEILALATSNRFASLSRQARPAQEARVVAV
ncbi:MAG: hypothetical protein M3Y35_12355, partial [Actinomycetota bacterium]|nr:hypothetical protein [Actinomycetota bacterium]